MYIEETGAGNGDLTITVEGEEYTAEANYDLDGNGIDETVAVMTDTGYVAYIDENADGQADVMQTIGAEGQVVSQARYDGASGHWTGEAPQQHGGDQGGGEQSMVLDTPQGDVQVGPATEDTNSDGIADTAVVQNEQGTMLVTDIDGDGSADQVVEIDQAGGVTISHHSGDGEWRVIEQGSVDQSGGYTPDRLTAATDDAAWTFDEQPPAPAAGGAAGTSAASGAPSDSAWN
ncbi:DUF6802 family protein [Saccharopolyspora cebuensis]|uniref:DUF6802 family protein n=1 Tax=Saccharopolyspora cebuensis TaxID=418759 RepID=A0ABV4CND7_9PSEU